MFYLIIIIWVILDLFTKNLALKYLQDKLNVLWDFLYLQYFENTGIAFSTQIPWLKYLTILLVILIFFYYLKERKTISKSFFLSKRKDLGLSYEKRKYLFLLDLSFWLILAWAIWNWIERILYWKVIDFIWVKYFSVFNLADSFITIWAILYLYLELRIKKNRN